MNGPIKYVNSPIWFDFKINANINLNLISILILIVIYLEDYIWSQPEDGILIS
jgi:hypothetical protein